MSEYKYKVLQNSNVVIFCANLRFFECTQVVHTVIICIQVLDIEQHCFATCSRRFHQDDHLVDNRRVDQNGRWLQGYYCREVMHALNTHCNINIRIHAISVRHA